MHPLLRSAIVVSLAMPWDPAMALNATVTESGELHSQPYFTAPRIAPVHRLSTVEVLEQQLAQEGVSSTGYRTAEVRAMLSEYDPDPREFALDPGTVDPRRVAALLACS